jgi:magnesium chelatase subunit I
LKDGFENTVIPELERAILSRHNINLLGLRGQAKKQDCNVNG